MRTLASITNNPALCSLIVAFIGSITSIVIAISGCIWSSRQAKRTFDSETQRLIGLHKLEVYENAIEEINYLVPLYRQLWGESFEKRTPEAMRPAIPLLSRIVNEILTYQKSHNAIGKAQIYSPALKNYVPFGSNLACVDYMQQLETVSKGGKGNSEFISPESKERVTEMYLLDELEKYERAAEELKEELAKLDYFQQ